MAMPKSQIQSMQSVMPTKVTDPPVSRNVSLKDSLASTVYQKCFHIILYYNKTSGDDSGWLLAGWTKESLGRALEEQPVFAGRLRRVEEAEGKLEIVSNDSGIRLFEAQISKTLAEILDLGEREREEAEGELVFWNDVDEQNPQFSPLFYIQVTNFRCGGYSVGLSCNLLLANPLATVSLLMRWANIHTTMVSEPKMTKLPSYYLPNLKPKFSPLTNQVSSNQIKDRGKTLTFKVKAKAKKLNQNDVEMRLALALACIEEAELKLGVDMGSEFALIVEGPSKEVSVESYLREGLMEKALDFKNGLTCEGWDDLEVKDVTFYGGNKPVRASYWINSISSEGSVLLIASSDSEMNVIVTI